MSFNGHGFVRRCMFLPVGVLIGCSMSSMSPSPGSIAEPPFPRTKSILPLALGNKWLFSYTAYDSLGAMINPTRMDLHLSISGGYGIVDDTTLVRVTYSNYENSYSTYVYQFEWEEEKKGHLVVYRDLYPLSKRGLYVVGEYENGKARLYPNEQLWLAYPAERGKTWHYNVNDSADSSQGSLMELVSTEERFYFMNGSSMTGESSCDCYLYKETTGATVCYYYYNETVGPVAFLKYVDGVLRVTYLLQSSAASD